MLSWLPIANMGVFILDVILQYMVSAFLTPFTLKAYNYIGFWPIPSFADFEYFIFDESIDSKYHFS